jgi:hypothetical protein
MIPSHPLPRVLCFPPIRPFVACIISVACSMASHHMLEARVKKWKPPTNMAIFKRAGFGIGFTALLVLLLRGPLYGALFFLSDSDEIMTLTRLPVCGYNAPCVASMTAAADVTIVADNTWCNLTAQSWDQCIFPRRDCSCAVMPHDQCFNGSRPCFTEILVSEQREHSSRKRFSAEDFSVELTRLDRGNVNSLVSNCLFPNRPWGVPSVFILGDSHAAAYVPAMASAMAGFNPTLVHAAVGHLCGYNSQEFNALIVPNYVRSRCDAIAEEMTQAF